MKIRKIEERVMVNGQMVNGKLNYGQTTVLKSLSTGVSGIGHK